MKLKPKRYRRQLCKINSSYIPKNSQTEIFSDLNAVVYRYEKNDRRIAIGYSGKRKKPDFHFSYACDVECQTYINGWLEHIKRRKEYKKEILAAKNAFITTLKPGGILKSSWGYDQTNIDYYKVISVKGKRSVLLQEIGIQRLSSGGCSMSAYVKPDPDKIIDVPFFKRVLVSNIVRLTKGTTACLWNGKPQYNSWYA